MKLVTSHPEQPKLNMMAAQETTNKNSGIMFEHKFGWYFTSNNHLNVLRWRNTVIWKLSLNIFRELIQQLISGDDETYFMVCENALFPNLAQLTSTWWHTIYLYNFWIWLVHCKNCIVMSVGNIVSPTPVVGSIPTCEGFYNIITYICILNLVKLD